MAQLNKHGEVGDFLDVDQFIAGKSAYECVAYSAALVKYAGPPGKGVTGTSQQVASLAQEWYAREVGSNDASNTNGMTTGEEYAMLTGIGLKYTILAPNIPSIKIALGKGYPILLCGAETGFYDMDLGDRIPYGWPPSGNHCIVASGIAADGNLLVHDCASIGSSGVRTGPRRYDISKMQLVSATAILVPWAGGSMQLYSDHSFDFPIYFTVNSAGNWVCTKFGKTVGYGIKAFYAQLSIDGSTLPVIGLPVTNEIPLTISGKPVVLQVFERAAIWYDVSHVKDKQPGTGICSLCHLTDLDFLQHVPGMPTPGTVDLSQIESDIAAISPLVAKVLADLASLKK